MIEIIIPDVIPRTPDQDNDYKIESILDAKNNFFNSMSTAKTQPIADTTQDSTYVHTNYLEYLSMAWGSHYGAIVDPKFFWHMILSELTIIIHKNPEGFREFFTTSDEKQEILVESSSEVLPIGMVAEKLKDLIVIDIDIVFPKFSTEDVKYKLAIQATLCDAVSPYYNYSMYLCDIPFFKILGSNEDWNILHAATVKLFDTLGIQDTYTTKLLDRLLILEDEDARKDSDTWESMFSLVRCGSGSQVEVEGWIQDFFVKIPDVGYPSNYSTHIGKVNYKDLPTCREYILYSGLFSSNFIDGYLIPQYDYLVDRLENE